MTYTDVAARSTARAAERGPFRIVDRVPLRAPLRASRSRNRASQAAEVRVYIRVDYATRAEAQQVLAELLDPYDINSEWRRRLSVEQACGAMPLLCAVDLDLASRGRLARARRRAA